MRTPQLLILESDGRLANELRELAERQAWSLRELRDPTACVRALQRGGPAVLVLRLGRDLLRELTLVERAAWLASGSAVVAVGDTDDPAVAALAWDLGATYVLAPPQPRHHLPLLVKSLMEAAFDRLEGPGEADHGGR